MYALHYKQHIFSGQICSIVFISTTLWKVREKVLLLNAPLNKTFEQPAASPEKLDTAVLYKNIETSLM